MNRFLFIMKHTIFLHILLKAKGLGPKTFARLHAELGSIDAIYTASFSQIARIASKKVATNIEKVKKEHSVTIERNKIKEKDISLISIEDTLYPELLRHISDPPPLLYVRGKLPKSYTKSIAIVGTRNCSEYGKRVCSFFCSRLAEDSFIIISGLAAGIDAIAHKESVAVNMPTLAVLGSGFDHIYPAHHKKLAQEIIKTGGALISEHPPETYAQKSFFPRRNRIIAGLSQKTFVIEAPERSGALITADFALDYNRDVFTIPGSIFSNKIAGNHSLIQNGAKTILSIDDIYEEYHIKKSSAKNVYTPENTSEAAVLELLDSEGTISSEEIAMATYLDFGTLQKTLSLLEIKGIIKRDSIGNVFKA